MKKAYVKPVLYAESFQLVEHISQGCGLVSHFTGDCSFSDGDLTMFATENTCSADAVLLWQGVFGENYSSGATHADLDKLGMYCYNSYADVGLIHTS